MMKENEDDFFLKLKKGEELICFEVTT